MRRNQTAFNKREEYVWGRNVFRGTSALECMIQFKEIICIYINSETVVNDIWKLSGAARLRVKPAQFQLILN